jgi:hypothetical protein
MTKGNTPTTKPSNELPISRQDLLDVVDMLIGWQGPPQKNDYALDLKHFTFRQRILQDGSLDRFLGAGAMPTPILGQGETWQSQAAKHAAAPGRVSL